MGSSHAGVDVRPSRVEPHGRNNPYPPIRDYAIIGDGRTVALVARDGSIDWLALPALDSPSVFARVLDAERGGAFTLSPDVPFEVSRRYLDLTNVLETTFSTAGGTARVTDAMTLPAGGLSPFREIVRRVEGVSGEVPMRWAVAPRFGYGQWPTRIEIRKGVPVATAHADAIAVCSWDAGNAVVSRDEIHARFSVRSGQVATIAMTAAHQEPLVFPPRVDVERRLDATTAFWRRWIDGAAYDGPWKEHVLRSALALKLLVHAPSGAVAAAPTTSLPESIGGERNWDYRYCWIRDTAFTLDALLQLGFHEEAHAFFWWFIHTTKVTHPRVQVLYRLDGSPHVPEHRLPFPGYRGSQPVRTGNAAAVQHQLDVYGDLFHTAWLYADKGYTIDRDIGAELAGIADLVCGMWRKPDRGIWEVRMPSKHFTHSKAMCWVALDRAVRLVDLGCLPARSVARWRHEAGAIRDFIEERCWSDREGSYTRYAGTDELDASLLLMPVMDYRPASAERVRSTVTAVRRVLGRGPLLARYNGADGLSGGEGVFVCCSFWLVHALALSGYPREAVEVMEETLRLSNDVGLFSEEMDPETGDFLGNFPQGLVHLALVNAAVAVAKSA